MFSIIGIVVVFAAVVGGYLMEKGNLRVLAQPAELIIIAGAAAGTVLIANPPAVLKSILAGVQGVFKGSKFTRKYYLDSLQMLYNLFQLSRKEGLSAVEADIDAPDKSKIFTAFPHIMSDHHVSRFICDTVRMATSGALEPFDVDQVMETDLEVHHHDATQPVAALSSVADSLPGLGIVAAVLGVVITMGALGGPPEEIGHKVAAALVGTFLGILLCYGLLGPVAANMARAADEENAYYQVLRLALAAFVKGTAPIMAVEMGRRAIPGAARPAFAELEGLCRQKQAQPAAA